MIIDWTNMEVTGISGIRIEMPSEVKISIFTDNDLTHITDDHFEIKLEIIGPNLCSTIASISPKI